MKKYIKVKVYNILIKIYRKLKLYNFNSLNFYLFFVLVKLCLINNLLINNYNLYLINNLFIKYDGMYVYKKYNYLIILKSILSNNYKIINLLQHIKYVDYRYYIQIVINYNNNIINNIKFDYFFKLNNNLNMVYYSDFKFRLNFYNFLILKEYMEYIRLYVYNQYLFLLEKIDSYPVIKIFLKYLLRYRLDKIVFNKKKYINNISIINKYHVYDIKKKEYKLYKKYYSKNININKFESNIFMLFECLISQDLFLFIDLIFKKFGKLYMLLDMYYLNIYLKPDNLLDIYKFNAMGLYSLYWQMHRYGFNVNYYYYVKLLYNSDNLVNIKLFNLYYLNNIYKSSNNLNKIFWYRVFNIIVIDSVTKLFLKIIRYSFKSYFKNKKMKFKRNLKFLRLLIKTYSLKFLPINLNMYYNKILLKNYLLNTKLNLDILLYKIFNIIDENVKLNMNLDIMSVLQKINLDNILLQNIDFFFNVYYMYLIKNIGKYYILNLKSLVLPMRDFIIKSIIISKKVTIKKKNLNIIVNKNSLYKFFLFNLYKNIGLKFFYTYNNMYNFEYVWKFEGVMALSSYITFINKYYMPFVLACYMIFVVKC